jgi:hypothetical protein
MNEHFHTYMHTRTTRLPLLCVDFMREFATGAPRFIVHTHNPIGMRAYTWETLRQ